MSSPNLDLGRSTFGNPANTGRLLPHDQALALLEEWVPNERLRLHMKQVAAVMKAWAEEKEAADELTARKWEQAGLLHDADWEKYPGSHCRIIIEKLEELDVDPEVIHCIASHGPRYFGVEPESTMDKMIYVFDPRYFGVEPESTMDKMIYVFDELSGFIHAAALIRPTRYEGMDVKSIMKKLKTASFAAQVSRDDITDAIARIDTPLEEIIQFIIDHQAAVQ
jgi:predicted hydrolase (HD superfamily)